MKTKTEIRRRARFIAELHYYSDVDNRAVWEPFEHYSEEWIRDEIKSMAQMLTQTMLWAQETNG